MLIKILVACILSGILYRAGGMGKEDTTEPKWIPKWMRKSFVRDWLCPLIALITLWLMTGFILSYWWAYLLFWGFSGVALSTYWDWLFGYDNYTMHGFMCGVAGIVLYWAGLTWWIILIRLIFCLSMGLWSKFIKRDVPQETGRGVLFIL